MLKFNVKMYYIYYVKLIFIIKPNSYCLKFNIYSSLADTEVCGMSLGSSFIVTQTQLQIEDSIMVIFRHKEYVHEHHSVPRNKLDTQWKPAVS